MRECFGSWNILLEFFLSNTFDAAAESMSNPNISWESCRHVLDML